jgi:hypothetical protein
MNQQASHPSSETAESLVITLELVPDKEEDDQDPAFLSALGRDTAKILQRDGYILHSVYTGQRGGPFLVEVVTTASQVATQVWDNRAIIEEVINDSAALITIFSFVVPIIKRLFHIHERHVGKDESQAHPITIVVEVDRARIAVAAADVTQADAALAAARRFATNYPQTASQATTSSKVTMQGRIPHRPRRRRK